MVDLNITDIKTFVPAKDYEVSKKFYLALGWKIVWSDDRLALMENANQRFYLQNYYLKEWADNFMLHISVDDTRSWKEYVSQLINENKFPTVRVEGPKQESYGALVTYVWDPSGVLLHFAQWKNN